MTKATYSIGSLGTYINGRGFKPEDWGQTGLPIIRIANLNNPKVPLDYFNGQIEEGHRIDTGDIVVSWSATLDAFAWRRGPAVLNQHSFKVIPKLDVVDPDYLYFVLKFAMKGLSTLVHGATMKHVTRPEFEGFEVEIEVDKEKQNEIAKRLKAQLSEVQTAQQAAQMQLEEVKNLANSIIYASVKNSNPMLFMLGDVLNEVKKGIGHDWKNYPVLGATRYGLAPAKEQPGKQALKYKPAFPGTVFYNPMRILIGSIAYVDEDDALGITSPDYVVLRGKDGLVDSRWFYHWLRSPLGEQCILSLARGAVRERMLFSRLAQGSIELPSISEQEKASLALKELRQLTGTIEQQLREINLLPQKILAQVFEK